MDRKAVELTWDDILSQITKIKKKNKINSKTKIYGVPKNGMILAGFFGCKNVYNPKEADFILDDIVDSGRTKNKYKKLYPKIKFLTLYTKKKNSPWVNFPFEKQVDEDQEDTIVRLLEIIGEDPNREGLRRTPQRYLDAFNEFLNPPDFLEEKIKICCERYNVVIFKGNRMSHLLSINSDKGKAINELKKYSNNANIKIIGLGDSPNDLPLLINSDFKFVIPSINGPNLSLLNKLKNYEFTIAERPNGHGWKHEITKLIDILELRR